MQFTISFTNQYVNLTNAPLSLAIQSGVPYYWAVLLDNTNFGGASWTAYTSSNITANLGTNQGWHTVWVGLSGRPAGSQAAWNAVRLDLDLTAPILTVTNALSVTIPMIQLQGYANEQLAWLTYDLNNANGSVSNQQAMITGQFYDTNVLVFTSNYFQCYDVALASGSNAITLHAADLAGNLATLTTNVIYSPGTNPPAIVLLWPQDGMQFSGSNITLQGQLDDPTATLALSVSDTNGDVSWFGGAVGRDGVFWLQNVALYAGTNYLALSASNAAGVSVTNFALMPSPVGLTIYPVQAGDTNASGTMDTAGYTIWVNGAQATQSGGTWSAPLAGIGAGGGLVAVTAIPNSDNGGAGSGGGGSVNPASHYSINAQQAVAPAQGLYISSYHLNDQTSYNLYYLDQNLNPVWYNERSSDVMNWQDGQGGNENHFVYEDSVPWEPALYDYQWPAVSWPQGLPRGTLDFTLWNNLASPPVETASTNTAYPPVLPEEHCAIAQLLDTNGSVERRTADTIPTLATGGSLGSSQLNLWGIAASATNVATGLQVSNNQIYVGNYGQLGTDGIYWALLQDNAFPNVPLSVPSVPRVTYNVMPSEQPPLITAGGVYLGTGILGSTTPSFCVGENVPFSLNLPPGVRATNIQWSLEGNFVNAHTNAVPGGSEPNSSEVYFINTNFLKYQMITNCWWYSGAANPPATYQASVSFTLLFTNGQAPQSSSVNGKFTMYQPTLTNFTQTGPITVTMYTSGSQEVIRVGYPPPNDTNAMAFIVNVASQYAGTAGITQVYDDQSLPTSYGSNVLDLAVMYPYYSGPIPVDPNKPWSAGALVFNDTPNESSSPGGSSVSLVLQFRDYVRFMPSIGSGPNIYVTLGKVTWDVNSSATNRSGTWVLTNSVNPVVPSFAPSSDPAFWQSLHAH
jgi:hypothetical protein